MYESVYIIASPVADVVKSAVVIKKLLVVRYYASGGRVGIEIVIYMQTVNIIPANDVGYHHTCIVSVLLFCWVQYI